MNKMRKSIFIRYFSTVAIIVFLSFTFFSGILIINSQRQWVSDKNKLLSKNVEIAAAMLSENSTEQSINAMEAISQIVDATIFTVDENGRCSFVIGKDSPDYDSSIDKSILKKVLKGKYTETGLLANSLNRKCFIVGVPIIEDGVVQGAVFATVPMKEANLYTISTLKTVLLCAVIVMLIAFVATYFASVQMTKPLRDMAQVVKKIESGDFSAKVPINRRDEIGLLAEAINKMTVSVGALEEMRSSFISSVSHELKTPMQTISGFVDGILDGTIPKKDTEKYLRIVSDETKRLARLVNSMLQLSRLQSEKIKLNKTTFNFSDMVISVFL
ncbi:MAG: HAMP domain-containing protein, partial [Clostridia bacterium]|nr:HAMP domain-containing protein [Clostridia bacterium]